MNLVVSLSRTDYRFLKVDASTGLYHSPNLFKAVNGDAVAIAIATQLKIKSEISKNGIAKDQLRLQSNGFDPCRCPLDFLKIASGGGFS